jgi:hypothetical protein
VRHRETAVWGREPPQTMNGVPDLLPPVRGSGFRYPVVPQASKIASKPRRVNILCRLSIFDAPVRLDGEAALILHPIDGE